jgi:hypothetical protein
MDKIKSLLLPLALVFAAIAVFEFGARYGATNMRAYAIASELQFPLNIYAQARSNMDANSKEMFALFIDTRIGTGALHRQIWYLDNEAQAALDKVLTYALSVRGDAVAERFATISESQDMPALSQTKLSEIRAAVIEAKIELIDNAPSVEDKAAAASE